MGDSTDVQNRVGPSYETITKKQKMEKASDDARTLTSEPATIQIKDVTNAAEVSENKLIELEDGTVLHAADGPAIEAYALDLSTTQI